MKLHFATLAVCLIAACSTSPLGRKQLMLVPDSQMDQAGLQAFDQVKQQTPVSTNTAINQYVQCVTGPITQVAGPLAKIDHWDVVVFNDDKTVNAFALPGGRIGVYSGILKVASTPAQLATVIAHETGHVIAKHGAERMSQNVAEQLGMAAAGQALGQNQIAMAALGVGAQVGLVLPFSRTQESEADAIGLDVMSEAGFDPHEAVTLWRNMLAQSKGAPPGWLSDHPTDQARIDAISARLPEALAKYDQAQAAGRHPQCSRP